MKSQERDVLSWKHQTTCPATTKWTPYVWRPGIETQFSILLPTGDAAVPSRAGCHFFLLCLEDYSSLQGSQSPVLHRMHFPSTASWSGHAKLKRRAHVRNEGKAIFEVFFSQVPLSNSGADSYDPPPPSPYLLPCWSNPLCQQLGGQMTLSPLKALERNSEVNMLQRFSGQSLSSCCWNKIEKCTLALAKQTSRHRSPGFFFDLGVTERM